MSSDERLRGASCTFCDRPAPSPLGSRAQQIPLAAGAPPVAAAGRRRQTNCQGLPAERLLSGCPQPERCQIACTSNAAGIRRIQWARQNGCKGSPISMASRTGSSRVQRWMRRTSSKSSRVTPATRTFAEFATPINWHPDPAKTYVEPSRFDQDGRVAARIWAAPALWSLL